MHEFLSPEARIERVRKEEDGIAGYEPGDKAEDSGKVLTCSMQPGSPTPSSPQEPPIIPCLPVKVWLSSSELVMIKEGMELAKLVPVETHLCLELMMLPTGSQ